MKTGDWLVQVLKPAYGLTVAPRRWWQQVCSDLAKLGWVASELEPCLWRLENPDGSLAGLIIVHVDDFLIGGNHENPHFQAARSALEKLYRWQPWEAGTFDQCGVRVVQNPESFHFDLDQEDFSKTVQPLHIPRPRRQTSKSPTTDTEETSMRGILGALQWRATQTAPWLQAELSMLLSRVTSSTVEDLLQCNSLYRQLLRTAGIRIRIDGYSGRDVGFVTYTDASWGCRHDGSSQLGYLVALTPVDFMEGSREMLSPIAWSSVKSPRVCRSSLAAEIQAIAEGQDEQDFCRLVWQEIETGRVDLGDYVSEIRKVPAALVCDCKSFFDAVNARESAGLGMRDKRSAIETLAIRNSCRETETPVLWVHSDAQIADGLTKGKVSFRLEVFFSAHAQIWRVIFDTVTLSARRRKVLGLGPLDEIAGSSPRDSECNSEI